MKKTLAILLAALMALLSGCTAAPAEPPAPAPTVESVAVAASNTPEPTAIPEPTQLERVQNAGKLVVAMCPDYAPYEFIDGGKQGQEAFSGADVSLARYIAESLGVALEIRSLGFDEALAAVVEGSADLAISAFASNAERAGKYELSAFYGEAPAETPGDGDGAGDAAEASAAPETARSEGGMVAVAKKGETELIAAVNEAIEQVNRDQLYAAWLDEALMLAEKLKLMG